jgi:dTDP-4-amino-4,6-dideoxygalactose transaminase
VVPIVDLTRRYATARPEFHDAVDRVLASGVALLGPETEAFESEFAAWTGCRHAVAVSSGASAIQLALAADGIGHGDEVIIPAFTAVPTASAVWATGARPVPVDVDDSTATIDRDAVIAATTERTAAVVPVHLYGRPTELDVPVRVVEDAAQAHGAVRGSRRSRAVAYSFYPTKNLGGLGDGGAVCTDDDELAGRLRRLRVHGLEADYRHVERSQNHRMSELEAAWLRLQLPRLEAGNERRRTIARHYRQVAPHLGWQADDERHVYHLCVFRSSDRDATRRVLADAGVATAVHYPVAVPDQPAFRSLARHDCPNAGRWAARCISVPCFPELRDDEIELVGRTLAALDP